MAQTFTFELEGAQELRNMLEFSGKDAGRVVGQVILEEANMIFARAMILTPIDTGALRSCQARRRTFENGVFVS